ncbi:MAG: hypothetical protein E8D40_07170 [Nitrospira sp.]|nr:MAG: hypothetical protein E8D40_07170 [Nitrospira sp.]
MKRRGLCRQIVSPTTHPDGVVRGEATLAQGLYTLIITPEGLSSSYRLRVQQFDAGTTGRIRSPAR